MSAASVIRLQIETALAHKVPSALTPGTKVVRPVEPTGIKAVDEILHGGLPGGAISELVGPECSGRTSLAFSYIAGLIRTGRLCAWIDVSDAFDPLSAAAAGVDLARLLWVRCGVTEKRKRKTRPFSLPKEYLVTKPVKKGLHGGSFGPHPRCEEKGLSEAVTSLLDRDAIAQCSSEPIRDVRIRSAIRQENSSPNVAASAPFLGFNSPWTRLEQALRSTDLLLQGGGFSTIVMDMGSLAPEVVSRVPQATWFRYRVAAERTQSSILLLAQHACAKSSAELLLRLQHSEPLHEMTTVFTGMMYRAEPVRRRFAENAVPVPRKPPQRVTAASWQSHTAWVDRR